jgi:hypothetical protein
MKNKVGKQIGNRKPWADEEIALLSLMIDVPTVQQVADILGRGLKSTVAKLYNLRVKAVDESQGIETLKAPKYNKIKDSDEVEAEINRRIKMFENLCKGQKILTKNMVNRQIAKYDLPTALEIISNNGSLITCKLKNGSIVTITKADIVSKEVLIAIMRDFQEVV